MKLFPKKAKFCPGCPRKELVLNKEPQMTVSPVVKGDTKVESIVSISNKKMDSRNVRLF